MIKENPRVYGGHSYKVVLVHGGPGAPGEMAPVAREISKWFGVLEPFQTKNSIISQVEELKQQIIRNADVPVILVGWSWGAWLSFIVAAENPDLVKKLILVGSGPFEASYVNSIMPTRLSHLAPEQGKRVSVLINILQKGGADDSILKEFGNLMSKADSCNPISEEKEEIVVDSDIYQRVWGEAEELRKSGGLLKYGEMILCPVVAIHGDYDPHPAEGVREPLSKVLNDFRFILLKNCGHHPWYEKEARDEFYGVLRRELE